MSNISGNTFFIENSINCSDLGTINGSVSFLDSSSNCGQVLNAIFSGGVNCGQACGCTVFYNSCSFGYVCGTGILRGNSVLYGAADCVIQCDQSVIDAGASVSDCEFLITTGTPTNIYSNDSCYYTYSNGTPTLATGAWSNGYFSNGSACQTLSDNVSVLLTACSQDSNLYYEYSDYLICAANGNYRNGYFCNGLLVNVGDRCYPDYDPNFCILYPIKPVPNASTSEYAQYCSDGTPREYEDGLYIVRDGSICFIQNKCSLFPIFQNTISIHKIKNTCPAVQGNFFWLFYNSDNCCLFAEGGPYTTSSGYFAVSAGVNLALGGNRNALIENSSLTCSSAIQAYDNCLYYTYNNGIASFATGLYSNYAINNGEIDCSYSTNMPTAAIDCGCQIYETGGALCVDNVNYILDNGCYYGTLNDFQYQDTVCAKPIAFKSNLCLFSLIDCCRFQDELNSYLYSCIFTFGNCSFSICCLLSNCCFIKNDRCEITPLDCKPNNYFLYCNGLGIVPNGLYSNYAFDNSISVNTNYNCALPQISLDNCCYYVYSTGVAAGATGAYSNYYFEPATSIATTCSITTPIISQDNCGYYLYTNGVAAAANGAYSNYYFEPAASIATACNITTPISGLDNGLFYNYCAGVPALANGPYSNFAFSEGCICTTLQALCTAIDNSCVYRYTDGVAMYIVYAQGTNVGTIGSCYYDVGACFQGGCGDGSITVGGDCCFLIGCNYCCADGADNCGSAYCALGTYVCYCLYDAGTESYCIVCCTAVNS